MNQQRPLVVVSATNLTEAGPLSVLKDCLAHASSRLSKGFRIIALVRDKSLVGELAGVDFLEFPLAKKSWLIRLYYEWFAFYRLSLKLRPHLWLSLHDLTPRVRAQRRAVYCHNAAMFYPLSFFEALREPAFAIFNVLYPLAYRINIEHNDWVIVQQDWIRKEFLARYPVRQVIVAHPSVPELKHNPAPEGMHASSSKIFFFPSYPRFFKNFEVLGEAARMLAAQGRGDFEVRITLDGTENRYARNLVRKYSDVPELRFIGMQPRERIYGLYNEADCLIFPSRLETWGLPLSEFKQFGKPILAADLPYAHETVGHYDLVSFFDPRNAADLAARMEKLMDGRIVYDQCEGNPPPAPFAQDWDELLDVLVAEKPVRNESLATEEEANG